MRRVFVFLTVEDVIQIHREELAEFGGLEGIRDRGGLESAVAQPPIRFGRRFAHKDEFEMAAAYAFHICRNHPFVDGNKRTALSSCLTFLQLNGIVIEDLECDLYDAMMRIAQGRMEKGELAIKLRDLTGAMF